MTLPAPHMKAIFRAWHAGHDSYDISKALKLKEDCVIDALAEIRRANSAAAQEGQNLTPKAMRA